MTRVADVCHGEYEDTRGGWWEFDGDGSMYGFDVRGKDELGALGEPTADYEAYKEAVRGDFGLQHITDKSY